MRLLFLTFLLFFANFIYAQAYLMGSQYEPEIMESTTNENTLATTTHPAFMEGNNINELDGAPEQLTEYLEVFCENVKHKNFKKLVYFIDGAEQFHDNSDKLENYIDNFWCGFEDGKKYNGTMCTTTQEIKSIKILSHKLLGDKTLLVKHKITTINKKEMIIELVMQLTSSNPKFIGTM